MMAMTNQYPRTRKKYTFKRSHVPTLNLLETIVPIAKEDYRYEL